MFFPSSKTFCRNDRVLHILLAVMNNAEVIPSERSNSLSRFIGEESPLLLRFLVSRPKSSFCRNDKRFLSRSCVTSFEMTSRMRSLVIFLTSSKIFCLNDKRNYRPIYTNKTEISLGETPLIRPAWAMVLGRIFINFSRPS